MDFTQNISEFDYPLPAERIAKFPLAERDQSKLLVYRSGAISDLTFKDITTQIPSESLVVFNNTKVVRARLIFQKETGARIEIFCLEPSDPADYEHAFAAHGSCVWHCIVGNSKKWKNGKVFIEHGGISLSAQRIDNSDEVKFEWHSRHSFGELLELLGKIPIPPYLERESQEIDNTRYQTTYSRIEGSVAAPTAGLHFSKDIIDSFTRKAEVTLHVGAGTFLPVKSENVADHSMHIEHFSVEIEELSKMARSQGHIIAVGTTTVRTLESLALLGERILESSDPALDTPVGQWEGYKTKTYSGQLAALAAYMESKGLKTIHGSTQIMVTPGYKFRTIRGLVTNFHQPKSTLLLLVSAVVGGKWRDLYNHALDGEYRFLSYGDSSLLFVE